MPDWLIEKGIGETRAVRIEADEIVEARVSLDGTVLAGTVLEAGLQSVGVPAVAEAHGCEYLLPGGAPGVTQGARLSIEVTRERLPGAEPWKRPLARVTDGMTRQPPRLMGEAVCFPSPQDPLGDAG